MGGCQCHPIVTPSPTKYDLRKHNDEVDPNKPLPSARSLVGKFDSLRSQSSGATLHSIRISPRSLDEVPTDNNKNKVKPIVAERHLADGDPQAFECDTISEKSLGTSQSVLSDRESDPGLGSECLSMAYSSSRSEKGNGQHLITPEPDDDLFFNSLQSGDLDNLESSQTSGFFGTISDRPYLCSRLGQRQTSHTSQDSREILQWKRGNRLGRGSFGTVWLGMTVTGELIAVKEIELIETGRSEAEKEYAKIYEEVSLLKEMRHCNIVGYLGSSYEKAVNHMISVFMEYVPGGSLANIIQKFGALEEPIVARYSRQLLDAVFYLHANNIVHRDIKSANILLMPDGVIKLIDFGCAKRLALRMSRSSSHLQKSLRGTPYWMAPEVINETGHGKKSDIWSVGCTVFELLTGKPPWGDREPLAAIYAIGSEEIAVPGLPDSFSLNAVEFVHLAMIRDKYKRPSAVKLLTHNFLKRPSSSTSQASHITSHH